MRGGDTYCLLISGQLLHRRGFADDPAHQDVNRANIHSGHLRYLLGQSGSQIITLSLNGGGVANGNLYLKISRTAGEDRTNFRASVEVGA